MKKYFCYFLVIVLILTGCTRNGSSASELTREFFTGRIEGEITISAYDSSAYRSFLEDAARAFEAMYPGTKVNIETFSAMPEVRTGGDGNNFMLQSMQIQDDPQSRTDYINRVSTNIMSGSGADIYAMDILPLHKFVNSNVLENLDQYMAVDPGFNKSNYRQNILDASRYQNGTWFIPLDYSFNYFAYDSTLIPANISANFGINKSFSGEDLLRIGMPLYNGTNRLFNQTDYARGRGGMFYMLLNQNIQNFINLETGRANFTDGRFTSLLNSVRNYSEQGLIPRGVTGQQAGTGRQMMSMSSASSERFYFKHYNSMNLMSSFTRDTGMFMRMSLTGSAFGIDSDDEIAGIEANADGTVPFRYSKGFSINSQSKNKLTAWTFLKFLLSKDMQTSANMLSLDFPVNNEARMERHELTFSNLYRGEMNNQQRQAMQNYTTAVETLSDMINYFVIQDTNINDMIAQDAQFFFDGSRTADEVARLLQNKTDLYLSE